MSYASYLYTVTIKNTKTFSVNDDNNNFYNFEY